MKEDVPSALPSDSEECQKKSGEINVAQDEINVSPEEIDAKEDEDKENVAMVTSENELRPSSVANADSDKEN